MTHVGIVLGEEQIRTRLRAGVAQPFGRNVAGLDVGGAVRRHTRELARVEQRGAEHLLQMGVRISIVGGSLLDRMQFQRGALAARESDGEPRKAARALAKSYASMRATFRVHKVQATPVSPQIIEAISHDVDVGCLESRGT